MEESTYIGLTCAFAVMFLTDVIGNSLVITVVLRHRSMQTPMNYLLVNLAIADMMVAVFISIQFILGPLYTHPDGTTGVVLCKLVTGGAVAWTSAVTSVFNLVAISVERYYAILYPHSEKGRINNRNLKYIAAGTWLAALFWNTPLFISVTYRYDIKTCGEMWPNDILPKIYSFGWNVVVGAIPMSIMVYMYAKVIRTLWFKSDTRTHQAIIRTRKRVTKMVIAVSVIYVICWTPSLVIYFLAYMLPQEGVHSVNHRITIVLATFNSSINPVIYSLQSTGFRKYLCETLCCGKPCMADSRVDDEVLVNQENHGNTGQDTQETPA